MSAGGHALGKVLARSRGAHREPVHAEMKAVELLGLREARWRRQVGSREQRRDALLVGVDVEHDAPLVVAHLAVLVGVEEPDEDFDLRRAMKGDEG